MAEKTIFEVLGNGCALCALEPRIQAIPSMIDGGLSWEHTFALGWFLGRYTVDDSARYCSQHRERIETLRLYLRKVGIALPDVSLLIESQ